MVFTKYIDIIHKVFYLYISYFYVNLKITSEKINFYKKVVNKY